ncbi:helix-turn-helix domain-containing protein [Streptomyces sp. NPDC001848]|uniref:helix-turn-helix domain-containing protein n=1 Tax=Streptomyces sp. NPDC001848 TaxID=3364618 RepID=UPI0036935580
MPVRADDLPGTAVPAPPPGLVTVGRFDQPPGYGINRPRGADSWLFTWTTGGRGTLGQGAARVTAGAGDLVVLGPGLPHRYGTASAARHWAFWWVHCQARSSWVGRLGPHEVGDRLYTVGAGHGRDRMETAFRRMLADARWGGLGTPPEPVPPADGEVAVAHGTLARELALCCLEEIVLLATGRVDPPPSGIDERIRLVEALITADPAAPHTVRSLAQGVSLSPSRFAHLFTEQLGHSPMTAVREARLRHAARLLEATELPVERVAAASGFRSPFHFNRLFRRRYGTPPGAYRAAQRGIPG